MAVKSQKRPLGLLGKALAEAETATPAAEKKKTVWLTTDNVAVSKAVDELSVKVVDHKTLTAQMDHLKAVIKHHCDTQFVETMARLNAEVPTPMSVQSNSGKSLTYVIQDKSQCTHIDDDVVATLSNILGPKAMEGLLVQSVVFSFDPDVMSVPGVFDAMEAAITNAALKLVNDNVISKDQAQNLVAVESKRVFGRRLLAQLPLLCGSSVKKINDVINAVGGALTRFVKL